jgi:hypothetical protein
MGEVKIILLKLRQPLQLVVHDDMPLSRNVEGLDRVLAIPGK